MLKGKTPSGFRFTIKEESADDWELMELLSNIDDGDITILPKAITILLGERQYNNLKSFIKKRDGRVGVQAMLKEFNEIMSANKETKN